MLVINLKMIFLKSSFIWSDMLTTWKTLKTGLSNEYLSYLLFAKNSIFNAKFAAAFHIISQSKPNISLCNGIETKSSYISCIVISFGMLFLLHICDWKKGPLLSHISYSVTFYLCSYRLLLQCWWKCSCRQEKID